MHAKYQAPNAGLVDVGSLQTKAQTCAGESPRPPLAEAVASKLGGLLERLESTSITLANVTDRLIGGEPSSDKAECRPPSAPGVLHAMSDGLSRAHDLLTLIDGSIRRLEREGL